MTESQWLVSEDPAAMLALLSGNDMTAVRWRQSMPGNGINSLSDRKLRLFACACARAMGLTRRAAAELILPAELLADGDRSRVPLAQRPAMPGVEWCYAEAGEGARRWAKYASLVAKPHRAHLLREIVGNTFQPVTIRTRPRCRCDGEYQRANLNSLPVPGSVCAKCFAGGPFWADVLRGVDPPWLTPQVLSLAKAAYEERLPDGTLDPFRLALVADALEEAGCADEAILRHLRGEGRKTCSRCSGDGKAHGSDRPFEWSADADYGKCVVCKGSGIAPGWHPLPGPHVRGCYVLDLLLGKE